MFVNLVITLHDTRYLKIPHVGRAGRSVQLEMLKMEKDIQEKDEDDPTMSKRAIAAQVGVSHSKLSTSCHLYTERAWPHLHEMG